VARFLSLDPAQAEYPAWSAYNYVLGNPISLIDPDGRRAGKTYDSETGLMIHDDGIDDHKVYLGTKSDGSDRRYIGQEEDFHDVTDLFTQTLNKTTQAFLDKRVEISETRNGRYDETEKLEFFNANVRPGGTYDIKNNPASPFYKGLKGETNEGIYFHGRAFFEGNLFRYDDFGNMNYGAAGRAMFGRGSEDFLKQAAGLAQLKECVMGRSPCYPKSSNYDEPRDQLFISVGYHMGNILLTGNP